MKGPLLGGYLIFVTSLVLDSKKSSESKNLWFWFSYKNLKITEPKVFFFGIFSKSKDLVFRLFADFRNFKKNKASSYGVS